MSLNEGLFSSDREDWETPPDFFELLDREFSFELDVCASEHNKKCERYFSKEEDALSKAWRGVCWMNPPYGRQIGRWIKKAYESSLEGATVVCLLPARTDTAWFHDYCTKGEIRLIRGRLKFVGAESAAPFPSMIVIFGKEAKANEIRIF